MHYLYKKKRPDHEGKLVSKLTTIFSCHNIHVYSTSILKQEGINAQDLFQLFSKDKLKLCFVFKICGKVVKNLDKHIDRCHMTEGSHPCEQCGKLFAAKANLLTHIKNIHKQIKVGFINFIDHFMF